ncbi:MAG: hypothetical protein WD432_00155 [Candidatus Saccharimonadales bacterium]
MFYKAKNFLQKLVDLILAGEFMKIKHSFYLRLNGILGKEPSLRSKIEGRQQELARVLGERLECDNTFKPDTIKVALIVRGGGIFPQSSAFIRLFAPLTEKAIKNKLSIKLYPENTVRIDKEVDICIVQRTAFDGLLYAKRLAAYLDANQIPLIVDTDDAFSDLTPEHSQYKKQIKLVKAIRYLIEKSDELWLSTQQLAESFNHPNKVVMPNTLDRRIWQAQNNNQQSKQPVDNSLLQILYTGTATHDSDLALVMPALETIASKNPRAFELTIIGVTDKSMDYPWVKTIRQPEPFGALYPNFVPWLLEQGPFNVGLSPLENSKFNESKSDIKCLDYLAAGILPIASDIKPYQGEHLQDFIIKVPNTEKGWMNALERVIQNPEEVRRQKEAVIPKAQEYIWSQRSSKQAAEQILRQIEDLVK